MDCLDDDLYSHIVSALESNLAKSSKSIQAEYSASLKAFLPDLSKSLESNSTPSPASDNTEEKISQAEVALQSELAEAVDGFKTKTKQMTDGNIHHLLLRSVATLLASPTIDHDIIYYLVQLPMIAFTPLSITAGIEAWNQLLSQRPATRVCIVGEICSGWLETIKAKKGLFNSSMDYHDPFVRPVAYAPTDHDMVSMEATKARRLLQTHSLLIQFLSNQVQAVKNADSGVMMLIVRLMMRSVSGPAHISTHPLAREVRFSLLILGFDILAGINLETLLEMRLRARLFTSAFNWFSIRPQWTFGTDRTKLASEIKLLQKFQTAIKSDRIQNDNFTSSLNTRRSAFPSYGANNVEEYTTMHQGRVELLDLLVENEISRLSVWSDPLDVGQPGPSNHATKGHNRDDWSRLVRRAWRIMPAVAVHMGERFKNPTVKREITRLVRSEPKKVVNVAEALPFVLGDRVERDSEAALRWLPVWAAVPPVAALAFFQPKYNNHPLILQYGMRVLEQHPVDVTFFFVPQVVQALRTDQSGYVERFIFETSKISQLFCHQIIWNMKANTCRGDDGAEEDPMKPLLDRMIEMIVADLSGKAKAFYDLEFNFFDEVTSISGKLKPFIKKSKPEKKAKIDDEMSKIKVSVGVYLPSNPDGVVVDIDRTSGRPLQSHAKAPFMATFKVQKEHLVLESDMDKEEGSSIVKHKYDVWQSAIFKVGDDCRQDVLALQIIAMFKVIFAGIGLTAYLFPYRVTATAPGCGVIDVVPDSISRDEMGRSIVNDLYTYFINKYGAVGTPTFEKARLNFIQSMAAYSVACYILQIKDRHNGNIMIDSDGHIVHIDFGFLFDIGPGGVKFEPSSFKLNREMVLVMGGQHSDGYKMFTELTVRAFLAIRPHAEQIIQTAHLMLGTELPSFQGEPTIGRLRSRFALELGEKQAAEYMRGVINNAYENRRSTLYDRFQKYQNGIPY